MKSAACACSGVFASSQQGCLASFCRPQPLVCAQSQVCYWGNTLSAETSACFLPEGAGRLLLFLILLNAGVWYFSCVIRETTQTGWPWSRPRVSLFVFLYRSSRVRTNSNTEK